MSYYIYNFNEYVLMNFSCGMLYKESDSLDEMDEDEDQGLTLQSPDLPENKIISPDNSEDDKFDKVQGLEYDNMEEEEEEDNEEEEEDEEEDSSESSEEDEEDEEEASEPQKPKGNLSLSFHHMPSCSQILIDSC